MGMRLAARRDWESATEGLREVFFDARGFLDRPFEWAVEARELGGLAEASGWQHGQPQNLLAENRFGEGDVRFGDRMAQLMDLLERGNEGVFGFEH